MAAKPKLTQEQWASVRATWEVDTRKGFAWLVKELVLPVSEEAVRQRSKQEGWSRGDEKQSLEKQKTKLGAEKPSLEKQASKKPTQKPKPEAIPEPEWEEVVEDETKPHGRPTKYMPHFDRQAYQLCLLGATDSEIAEFFEVTEQTVNNWKRMYVTFFESLKRGKLVSDAEAAASLFKRATGYRYKEVKTKQVRPMADDDGDGGIQAAGEDSMLVVEVVTTEKEMPPDTSAAFLWLKNRRPKDWRDKIEVENTHKLNPEMLDRIKTEFVDRMAMARERQRQVLIDRGLVNDG